MPINKLNVSLIFVLAFFLVATAFGQTQNISICSGKSVSLMPTLSGDLYSWNPDASLSAFNVQNPTATPSANNTYTVVVSKRSANNLVINGDFEQGNQDFTTEYNFLPGGSTLNGTYGIYDNPNQHNRGFSSCRDHTGDVGGKMLVADGASGRDGVAKEAKIWTQTVPVIANTQYAFSAWITNISNLAVSSLKFSINDELIGSPISSLPGQCNWQEFYVAWDSGNATTATISIAEGTGGDSGNDFALDDIAFYKITQVTETIKVTVMPPAPTPVVTGDHSVCLANSTNLISSSTTGTWASSNPSVATVDVSGKITPISLGKTDISYTQNDFCNSTSLPFEVTVTAQPQLEEIQGLPKLTIAQQSVLTINLPDGTWRSTNEAVATVATDGTVKGIGEGQAEITYEINTPCGLLVSLPFTIAVFAVDDLYAPNAFTPNGDGNNDEFRIYGSLIDKIELNIFNQWGQQIYKTTDITKGWTGIYKGEPQPAGVYIFTAKLKMINGNEVIKKGTVNLIR